MEVFECIEKYYSALPIFFEQVASFLLRYYNTFIHLGGELIGRFLQCSN